MDFRQLILARQSDRAYKADAVKAEDLALCLEAAHLAPSARNLQPWHFIVVDDAAKRAALCSALEVDLGGNGRVINAYAKQAPVLVAFVAEERDGAGKWKEFDLGAAVNYFCLQAAELGLGTCIMGGMQQEEANQILALPAGKNVSVVVALGYPAAPTRNKVRKDLQEMTTYNRY